MKMKKNDDDDDDDDDEEDRKSYKRIEMPKINSRRWEEHGEKDATAGQLVIMAGTVTVLDPPAKRPAERRLSLASLYSFCFRLPNSPDNEKASGRRAAAVAARLFCAGRGCWSSFVPSDDVKQKSREKRWAETERVEREYRRT